MITNENEKVVTFTIDVTEALLATLKENAVARENVRAIMYRRVDDFIKEASG